MKLIPRRSSLLFLVGVALCPPVSALTPPPDAPCTPANPVRSVAALRAIVDSKEPGRVRECAAEALVAWGTPAVPAIVQMLESDDTVTLTLALAAVKTLGPRAQAAVPVLMRHLERLPPALEGVGPRMLYQAVGAIGPAAASAVPLLINHPRLEQDYYFVLMALGELGAYDAERAVPFLISILEGAQNAGRRAHAETALTALQRIGKPAHKAVPSIMRALDQAMAARDSKNCAAAIRAVAAAAAPEVSIPVLTGLLNHPMLAREAVDGLSAMGPSATTAVPALIAKLNGSRSEQYLPATVIAALYAIAPTSPLVQRQLLLEVTQHRRGDATYLLAHIRPLPADFAPELTAVLAKNPGDFYLKQALANAHAPK